MAKIRERLNGMEEVNRRNKWREQEFRMLDFLEAHMRDRLAEIRAKEIPAENEWLRQEIINRYEHDLSTWVAR